MFKEDFLTSDIKKEDIYKLVQNEFLKNFGDSDIVELTKEEQESIIKELGFTHGYKSLEETELGYSKGNVIHEMLNRSIDSRKIPVFKDRVQGVEGDFTIGFVGTKSRKSKSLGYDLLLPIIFKRAKDGSNVTPIGIASEAIPNITKSVYTQNGTLYSQPLVKDIGDGPRNERIVTTAAFDLKRYINTFFKNTNKDAEKIIESFNTNVFNDKVGSPIYRYRDRAALESNSPLLQHQHKTLSAPSVLTTSNVGSGKDHFGNINKKNVFLDSDLLNKMIPGIAEAESQNQLNSVIRSSFRDGADNNFIFNKDEFKNRVKNYYSENARKNIDPFYYLFDKSHEQRINKYMEFGATKKQILSALGQLDNDRKDYFGSIRSTVNDINSYERDFITSKELKGIIEKNRTSTKDGAGKKVLDTIEKRLDYILEKNGKNINGKTDLKETIETINKQYSEVGTLLSLVQGQRKVERVSFEDFEIASKSDSSTIGTKNRENRNLNISKAIESKLEEINKTSTIKTTNKNLYIDGNIASEKIAQNVYWAGSREIKMFTPYDKEMNVHFESIKIKKEEQYKKPILNSDIIVIMDNGVPEGSQTAFSDSKNRDVFDLAMAEKKDIIVYTDRPLYYRDGKEVNEAFDLAKYNNVYLKTGSNYKRNGFLETVGADLKKDLSDTLIGFGRTNPKNRIEINKSILGKENALYLNIFDVLNDGAEDESGKSFESVLKNTRDKNKLRKTFEHIFSLDMQNKKTIETLKFLQGKNLTYHGNEAVAEVLSEYLNEKIEHAGIKKENKSLKFIIDDEVIAKNVTITKSPDNFSKKIQLDEFNLYSTNIYGVEKPGYAKGGLKKFLDTTAILDKQIEHYSSGLNATRDEWNLKIIENDFELFDRLKKEENFFSLSKKEKSKVIEKIASEMLTNDVEKATAEATSVLGDELIVFRDRKYIDASDDLTMLAETIVKKNTALKENTDKLVKSIVENIEKGKVSELELEKLDIISKRSPLEYKRIRETIYKNTGFDIGTKQSKQTSSLFITKESVENGTLRDIIKKGIAENKPVVISPEIQKDITLNKKLNESLNAVGFKSLDFRIDNNNVNIQEEFKADILKGVYDNKHKNQQFKSEKIITLEAITSTRGIEKVYDEFDKENSKLNNFAKDEMMSSRVMYNPRLNISMEYEDTTDGASNAKFKTGMFFEGSYHEIEIKTKFTNADASKAVIEEAKRNTFIDSEESISKMRNFQKAKVMLGLLEDRISTEGRKGYINFYKKSYKELEKIAEEIYNEQTEGYEQELKKIEDVRISLGIRSMILNADGAKMINAKVNKEGRIANSNNNMFKAFELAISRNLEQIERPDVLSELDLEIKLEGGRFVKNDRGGTTPKGGKSRYSYTPDQYIKSISPLIEITGTANKTKAEKVEIITNRIIDSDLDDKTKRSLLYFTPSPDGDVNRELYKQTAFLLSAESGTFANNLNKTTVYEYMKFLTKTEGGKRTAESAMGTTQLNKRVFLSDDFSEYLKRAFLTGEDLSTTSLINKQQNTIAGKFFMTVMDSISQGNFLNALGQRSFQASDLRGDLVVRQDGVNKNLNVLMSEVSSSMDPKSSVSKNIINNKNAIDTFNIIESVNKQEIEEIVRYENNKVRHVVLVGDLNDTNIDRSIYGYSAAFQEGSLVSKESAAAANSVTLQKHKFSIYKNINYEKFSKKVGVEIKDSESLYQFFKANPEKINELFSSELKKNKANQKLLVEGLEYIKNMNGSNVDKLYELAKLRVAGEINKKVSVDVDTKNVENVLGYMFYTIQNLDADKQKELEYVVKNYGLLKDIKDGKYITDNEIKTQKSKLMYGMASAFFGGSLKEEKTLVLDKDLFTDTFGDSYMYRKVSSGITLESITLTRDGLELITGDVSEVTKASKMYSSGQKYTASVMPDYIKVVDTKGVESGISAIINMKLEKRGQVGSMLIDAINTSLTMVYDTDKTKVSEFATGMKDIYDILMLDVNTSSSDGIYHSFRHIEKLIKDTNGDYNLMKDIIRNPEKATEYHFANKKIKEDIIAKYGNVFQDDDKAHFALMLDIAKRYDKFNKEQLGGRGDSMVMRNHAIKLGVGGEEIEVGSGDIFIKTYTNMAKSAATESKKSHDGMKLNYIMEKMFGIQGYKILQEEIDRNGMKEGTEVLVKTLTSLHDEFSIGRNVNMDQLASVKYQDKLISSLAESFNETFGKTVDSYDGSSAHILGKEDSVDGSFKRAVAVIDLAKVSDKEYFIRDLGENGKSITELANFDVIQNGSKEKQYNIVKESLEHKIVVDFNETKDISVLEKYIGEARNERLDLGGVAKKLLDSETQINVFDSYIGKSLVEAGIINKSGIAQGKIKGEIIITDSKAFEKYADLKSSSDYIKEIVTKNLILGDEEIADTVKKVELMFQGKLTNDSDFYFLTDVKNAMEKAKDDLIFQTPKGSYKIESIEELTAKTLKTIEFIEKNVGNKEVMNSFANFYKNFGIRADVINLDFDLESANLDKVVTSDSTRMIENAIKNYIEIDNGKKYIEILKGRKSSNVFDEINEVFKMIETNDEKILSVDFSLRLHNLTEVMKMLKNNFEEEKYLDSVYKDFDELKAISFNFIANTNTYMKNKSLLAMSAKNDAELEATFKNVASDLLDIRETMKAKAKNVKENFDILIDGDMKTRMFEIGEANKIMNNQHIKAEIESLTEKQFVNFELNLQESTLSSKKSELFQSMRFNMGTDSRVVKPLEGSLIEELIGNKLINSKDGAVDAISVKELEELIGKKIVRESLLNSANDSLHERRVTIDYLDMAVKKKNKTILNRYFDSSEVEDILSGKRNLIEEISNNMNYMKNLELTPGQKFKNGVEHAIADIVMKNRIAELSEIAIYDASIDKSFDYGSSNNGFARTQIFFSRHPQQTQYHTTGMTSIALNTKQNTKNALLAEITELLTRSGNNEAGVMLIGKKTFKNKRGDFDGDAGAVAFLKDQTVKNMALFHSNSMNYVFENENQAIEFVDKKNKIIDVSDYGSYTFRKFIDKFADKKTTNLIMSENDFDLDSKLGSDWGTTNRILLGLKDYEYKSILEINKSNNFYIKGRIEDEFVKHRNAYKEFLYHVTENKKFAEFLDVQQERLSKNEISKSEFDKIISSEYKNQTGESGKDFEKLIGKPELSKFFDPKENVSTYNKAVNIKNTGIVFEETAKYRVPGLSMYNFDIAKFMSDNSYLENVFVGETLKNNLENEFKGYAKKQFLFSKLADIYYDNANEAAISAKHGLSLDGLKDVRDKIGLFQGDKNLGDMAVEVAEKITSGNLSEKQTIAISKAFQESYYNKGFGYEFIDNADKDFTNTFGSKKIQFESWNSSKLGKSEVDELRVELIDLKSRSEEALSVFKKAFIADEGQFEKFLEGENFNYKMFKTQERNKDIEFSGVTKNVDYKVIGSEKEGSKVFDEILGLLGNEKKSTSDLSNLLGVMQHINRTYNVDNKVNDIEDSVKNFAREFGIAETKDAKSLMESFSSILVVFSQNERNADLKMETFDKAISQVGKIAKVDDDFVELKQVQNVLKTVSSVMADVSITSKFFDLYGIKVKNDFMELAITETKIEDKTFNKYLAEVAYKLDNELEKVNADGFMNYLNRNGMDYKEHLAVIDKLDETASENINYLAEKTMREINASRNRFDMNPSAEISRVINFGTTSTNAGVSDFQGYLSKIMDSIRTGRPIDISESSISLAASKTKVLLKEIEYSTTLKFFQNEEIISYYENNLKFLGTEKGKSFVEAINKSEVEALENIKVNFSGLGESNIGNDFFKQISGRTNVHEIKDIISDYKTEVNALNQLLENKGDEAIDFVKNRGLDSIEILKVYGLYKDGKVSLKELRNLKTIEVNKILEAVDSAISEKISTGVNLQIANRNLSIEQLFGDSIGIFDKKLSDEERIMKIVSSYSEYDANVSKVFLSEFVQEKLDSVIPSEEKIKWTVLEKLIRHGQDKNRSAILNSIQDANMSTEEKIGKVSTIVKNTEKIMKELFESKYFESEFATLKAIGPGEDFLKALGNDYKVTKVVNLAIGQQILSEFTDEGAKRKIKDFAKRSGESFFQKYGNYINLEDYKMNKNIFIKSLEADFAMRISEKVEQLAGQDYKMDDVLNDLRKHYKTNIKNYGKTLIGDSDKTMKELEFIMNKTDFKKGAIKGGIAFASIAATMFGLSQIRKVFSVTETTVPEEKKKEFDNEASKMDSQKVQYSDLNLRFK